MQKRPSLEDFFLYLNIINNFLNEGRDDDIAREAWERLNDQLAVVIKEYLNSFPEIPEFGFPDWAVRGAILYGVGLFKVAYDVEKERRKNYMGRISDTSS